MIYRALVGMHPHTLELKNTEVMLEEETWERLKNQWDMQEVRGCAWMWVYAEVEDG